jgi:glycosyltransferase involved in cell wall biosynthesis
MPGTPLVSFCIPTYGRARYLAGTVASALAQTMSDLEVIIVNDCSPDDTEQVARSIDDPRVRYYLNERNLGVPENLNRAMSYARGEFLVLLEDHDLLDPTYLEESLRVAQRHPSVGFVATGLHTIDAQDRAVQRFVSEFPEFMQGRRFLRRMLTRTDCPFSVTSVIRRSATEGLDPLFDPRYWWYADQYLWLRLASRSDFGYVAKPLLQWRLREDDHYLNERVWQSLLCVERIHRDAWPMLHGDWNAAARWDWCLYELQKLRQVVGIRAGRILRELPWQDEDRNAVADYLAPPGRWTVAAMGLLPLGLLHRARSIYRRHRARIEAPRA